MTDVRLFKYLRGDYAKMMVEQGKIRFGNLTRFKQMEHEARGDVMEGCHVHNPSSGMTLANHTRRSTIQGMMSFRRSIQDEKVLVYCVSCELDNRLYDAFEADCCVEISNVNEFYRRVRRAVKRMNFIDPAGLLHGHVVYYKPNEDCGVDVNNGCVIPFLKHHGFADQNEYRFVFARKGGMKVTRRIIRDQNWDTEPDHLKGTPKTCDLIVGSLQDICRIHHKGDVASKSV